MNRYSEENTDLISAKEILTRSDDHLNCEFIERCRSTATCFRNVPRAGRRSRLAGGYWLVATGGWPPPARWPPGAGQVMSDEYDTVVVPSGHGQSQSQEAWTTKWEFAHRAERCGLCPGNLSYEVGSATAIDLGW